MQIGVLGPLEVRVGDRIVPVAGARLRRLLTRLAVDAPRPVSPAELVEAVWPDDPPTAVTNSLQSLVSRLRRGLGDPALIQQVPTGYRLAVEASDVDAITFTALVATGRQRLRAGDALGAKTALVEALALWRGAALVDADDAPYSGVLLARWEQERLAALGDRIDADLQLGAGAEVIGELEELVAAHPLHEQFVSRLMAALGAAGRTADALTAYQSLRARLADELGTDPGPDLQAQHLQLLRGSEPDPNPAAVRHTNLRAEVSSFVGREAELGRVAQLLDAGRLTTIVGPGGAGKTRLAEHAATPWVERLRDGVWMVELAPVTEETSLARAVLSALGMQANGILDRRADLRPGMTPADRMFAMLADSDALLVVDNCEHLIGGVADLVAAILQRCPAVRVLATSREPLGIPGEALCAIPPLGLPPEDATAGQAAGYPAVELLLARGSAARGGFRPHRGHGPLDRADRPPARRTAVGHRARGGQVAGAAGVRDRRTARRPVPAAGRRRAHRGGPAPHPPSGRRVELGPVGTGRAVAGRTAGGVPGRGHHLGGGCGVWIRLPGPPRRARPAAGPGGQVAPAAGRPGR